MKIKDNLFIRFFHNKEKRMSACEITIMANEPVTFTGTAKCHSNDQFAKKNGRNYSMKRAIKQAGDALSREDRTTIWQSLANSGIHMY